MQGIIEKLIRNSKAAQFACIEIHNKPIFSFRYEVCTILNINSWELILKAFILKYYPEIKVVNDDGTSKPFDECLNFAAGQMGKEFIVAKENIQKIYEYRCNIIHFYLDDVEVLLLALLSKNVILYHGFLLKYFEIDIASEANLLLLPIGFKKLISPIDFLSNSSGIKNSSQAVQQFVKSIINSTEEISKEGIEDSILLNFKMSLVNEARIKNADIVAAITKDDETAAVSVKNVISRFTFTNENEDGVRRVKIDEENLFKTIYTQTHADVVKQCNMLFLDFKQNLEFNAKLKKLKNNPEFHKRRYLNLNNPNGGGKDYYSEKIYRELANYYTLREPIATIATKA